MMSTDQPIPTSTARRVMTKVPEIAVIFWVLKLLTTGMGESMSDFLGQHSVPIAGAIGIFGLWFAIWLQMRQREYRAPIYWFAVMMVAIFGTMAADGIHDGASIPYAVTTPLFAVVMAAVFFFWYRSEGTLSIHSITTRRREGYLLGRGAGDVRARHSGGRSDRDLAEPRLLRLGAAVRRDHRRPRDRLVAFQHEPDRRLLVRVHRHSAARRLLRGLVHKAALDHRVSVSGTARSAVWR